MEVKWSFGDNQKPERKNEDIFFSLHLSKWLLCRWFEQNLEHEKTTHLLDHSSRDNY